MSDRKNIAKDTEETIQIIDSVKSLMKCLSHRDLTDPQIESALAELKKSVGFKKMIGEISSVHVLNFGNAEAREGAQRFRMVDSEETLDHNHIVLDKRYILQIYKKEKWVDANQSDLSQGSL